MKQMSTNSIELIYVNNVIRKTVGFVEYDEYYHVSKEELWTSIFKLLEKEKHPFDEKRGRFYVLYDDSFSPINVGERIIPSPKSIVYSEIVAVNNAYRYDEVDGVLFFFHTNENNHIFFPHIHASYSGKEILVSLNTLKITGSLGNRKKERTAILYVSQNKDKLIKEWNKLVREMKNS